MLARPESRNRASAEPAVYGSRYFIAFLVVFILLAIGDCYVMWILFRGH